MRTDKAMKIQKLRYFSSLTTIQKDKTVNNILRIKHGLTNISEGLANTILYSLNDYSVTDNVLKQKMFLHKGFYYPLNFKEIVKS
jgi:hypothetical protein